MHSDAPLKSQAQAGAPSFSNAEPTGGLRENDGPWRVDDTRDVELEINTRPMTSEIPS